MSMINPNICMFMSKMREKVRIQNLKVKNFKVGVVKFSGDLSDARKMLEKLNVDPVGVNIMAPKMILRLFEIRDLDLRAANILKQECLSIGAELALPKKACELRGGKTGAILIVNLRQLDRLCAKLRAQHYGLPELGVALRKCVSI